jgi:hypothetical protein
LDPNQRLAATGMLVKNAVFWGLIARRGKRTRILKKRRSRNVEVLELLLLQKAVMAAAEPAPCYWYES